MGLERRAAVTAAVVLIAGGLSWPTNPAAHTRAANVTWTADVQPILQRHCVRCHEPNGFAPMSLVTYDEARAVARPMREAVLERRMPPWPARRGVGTFLNDPTLSQAEVEVLAAWAGGGAPRGPEVPMRPGETATPARGPDLVATIPAKHVVSNESPQFRLDTGLTETAWIERWELLPGNRAVVAQASVAIENGPNLGSWVPGELPASLPAGHAWRLPAAAGLVLDIRYRQTASQAGDRSAVALYFARGARREVHSKSLPCGRTILTDSIDVVAVRARAAQTGQNVEVTAREPDGRIEPLVWILGARPDREPTLRLRAPLRLRRGTGVTVTASSPGCSADLFFAGS